MKYIAIFLALAACAPESKTPEQCEEMRVNLYVGNPSESEIGLALARYRQECVIEG